MGMWIFLATEIMFFGGLFAAYTIYRHAYPAAFDAGSRLLDWRFGATNTAVLICSSLTMAMAVHSAQLGKRKGLIAFLICTILLGLLFLGLKFGFEWPHDWAVHTVPSLNWAPQGEEFRIITAKHAVPQQVELFMFFYFVMTGLHALHMIVGVGLLAFLVVMARAGHFSPENPNPIEMSGLYWHFVDIVWIFLFPLLYLAGGLYS